MATASASSARHRRRLADDAASARIIPTRRRRPRAAAGQAVERQPRRQIDQQVSQQRRLDEEVRLPLFPRYQPAPRGARFIEAARDPRTDALAATVLDISVEGDEAPVISKRVLELRIEAPCHRQDPNRRENDEIARQAKYRRHSLSLRAGSPAE